MRALILVYDVNKGPKKHINVRISHSGSQAQYVGYTRNHVCVFMWSFGAIDVSEEISFQCQPGGKAES